MAHSGAKVVLFGSVSLLIAVGAVWFAGDRTPSSDLAGEQVRLPSSSASPAPASASEELTPSSNFFPKPRTRASSPRAERRSVAETRIAEIGLPNAERPTFPKRITIASLGVDADIVSVGLETDGSMEIPGATEAGWYHYGPRPGDAAGSAVLAGHVDHLKQPGVFILLRRIKLGSPIEVVDADGSSHRFVVTERFQIDKDELPAWELFRTEGAPVLTLITCGGKFSSRSRHYADNIVIRATPVYDPTARAREPVETVVAA